MKKRGFTLLEVLVAVAVLALMIVSTSALLQRIQVNSRETRDKDLALRIARDQLEKLRADGYAVLPANSSFSHTLLTSLDSSTAAITVTEHNAETKQLVTTVSWRGSDGALRSVALTTLITETGGLP
jgi:type II secretion system protein I